MACSRRGVGALRIVEAVVSPLIICCSVLLASSNVDGFCSRGVPRHPVGMLMLLARHEHDV